jgi:hypothetical protein
MQQASAMAGKTLTYVPREVLHLENEDTRACCAVAQCFGLCYLCDLIFTVPTMQEFEEGLNKRSLPLFAFYELCWPCMWFSSCCCAMTPSRARDLPRQYIPWLKNNSFDNENELLNEVSRI